MAETDTSQWWLAAVGNRLIWARLTERESGHAEVLAADGRTMQFASIEAARAALLDAEFRAFDGLDEEDAAVLGFDLASTEVPKADDEAELVKKMIQTRPGGHA